MGWSLVQMIPTECGVSECDHESLIMRRPSPSGGCGAMVKKNVASGRDSGNRLV